MFDVRCTQCGAVNSMGSRFCESCGSSLSGSNQQPPPKLQPAPPPLPPRIPPPMPQRPLQPSAAGAQQNQKALASLILGIVGLLCCGVFTSIPGMIVGKSELNAIREGRSPASNESLAKAGFYISLAVTILYILVFIAALALGLLPLILERFGQ